MKILKFKNGKLSGKGYDHWDIDTTKFEFKDGMEHGLYEFTRKIEGKLTNKYLGNFKLNKRDGIWVIFKDGKTEQTTWSNGIKQN